MLYPAASDQLKLFFSTIESTPSVTRWHNRQHRGLQLNEKEISLQTQSHVKNSMASKPAVWLYSLIGDLEMERLEVVCCWLFSCFAWAILRRRRRGGAAVPPVLTTLKQQWCYSSRHSTHTPGKTARQIPIHTHFALAVLLQSAFSLPPVSPSPVAGMGYWQSQPIPKH